MRVDLFDYELPEHLIAATPVDRRDQARLLVLDRLTGSCRHRRFGELPELLRRGDLLVLNDARVIPARLHATRESGGKVDLLLVRRQLRDALEKCWLALVSGSGRLREGEALRLDPPGSPVTLCENRGGGWWSVSLDGEGSVEALLERAGAVPLPPYVHRARRSRGLPEEMPELDRERYQTVYAREPGAVAAPTAGLHFTEALLERVREAGVEVRALSLLVGPGTFQPVRAERVCDHRLEAEFFRLPAETACAVSDALQQGRRVVATGTTACRVLEHVARHGPWQESSGWTDLFIYPPFEFKAVGALITNFHLPRSTLLMLVAAFAGRDKVLDAYREAVREGYRFYSYGDAMFIA